MCPKRPGKEWRTKSFRLQSPPTGKRPKVCPRTRLRDYISDLVWPRLGVEPAELYEIAVDCEVLYIGSSLGCFPSDFPERKSGHDNEKMDECVGLQ